MWKELIPFKDSSLNLELQSKVWVESDILKVAFNIKGDLEELILEDSNDCPRRIIGLWESTCFEAFIKNSSHDEYLEFNVSSACNWNVFHFLNKKSKLKEYENISNLAVNAVHNQNDFTLSFWLPLNRLPANFWSQGNMRIGLTSVFETESHELSYWAISHNDVKPNFHHFDSFIYNL